MAFTVGQGVLDLMAEHGDEARSDEIYTNDSKQKVVFSLTQGRDAMYRWTPADGVKRLPFE